MRNIFSGLVMGLALGAVIGFGAGIYWFPFLFPPPAVNETVAEKETKTVLAKGRFIHADPSDSIHWGKGGVSVYEDLVHLEADFKVGPGPKYHVYLVPEANVGPRTEVEETMFVDLGRLKAFEGSQNYPLPAGLDLKRYPSIVIWCEQFDQLISPASISIQGR